MNKAGNHRHPSGTSRVKTLWKAREAKEKGGAHHDQTSEQQIVRWLVEELWDKHLLHPTLALDEALRRVWLGTTLTFQLQAGAELERLHLLSKASGLCRISCRKTNVFLFHLAQVWMFFHCSHSAL